MFTCYQNLSWRGITFRWLLLGGIFLLTFLAGRGVLAQNSPLLVQVDQQTITADELLSLQVVISGEFSTAPAPDLSHMTDFIVVSRSSSSQVSIINGQMTSRSIFSYQLQPLNTGFLTIPAITVTIEGETHQSEAIEIEVFPPLNPGSATPMPSVTVEPPANLRDQTFLVEAEVDNPNPYLGQQIIYTFRFYRAIDSPVHSMGQPDYREPAFTNFWSHTVLSQPTYTTQVNEKIYSVTEIQTALFPANLGSLTIDSAQLVIPGGLFNPDIILEAKSVTVNVRPVPEGAPEDFEGAIGQFEIRASLDANEGQIDEPLTLVIEVEGTGNIEILSEPELPELSGWRVFDSQAKTRTEIRNSQIYGLRRFERIIFPSQAGELIFPAISFSYFDPEIESYETIRTDPIPVMIAPGEGGRSSSVAPDQESLEEARGEIHALKPVPSSLSRSRIFLLGNLLYWIFWFLPLLVIAGVFVWHRRRQRLLEDVSYMRRRKAYRTAQKILVAASNSDADSAAAAHRALLGYLSDKLDRPTSGLTTENLSKLLQEHQIETEQIEEIMSILDQIDASRFAPIAEAEAQNLLSQTQQLISKLEKSFGGRQ